MDMTQNKISWWRPLGFALVLCLLLGGMIRATMGAKAQGDDVDLNDSDVNEAGAGDARLSEPALKAIDEYISEQMRSARIPGL